MGKNKTIPSGERTIILRVLHFFEEEKKKGSPLLPLNKALSRTSTATGVSLSTITRIKKEELKILQEMSSSTPESGSEQISASLAIKSRPEVVLPTPGKKRQTAHNKLAIDDFTICAIKNIVNNFYEEKKELPTLKKILAVAKADFNFPGQKETLRKILREKCGYTFTKCIKKKNNLLRGGNEIGYWRARNPKSKDKKQIGVEKKRKKIKNNDFSNKIDNEHSDLDKTKNEQNEISETIDEIKNDHGKFINATNEFNEMENVQKEKDEFSEINNVQSDFRIAKQSICHEVSMVLEDSLRLETY